MKKFKVHIKRECNATITFDEWTSVIVEAPSLEDLTSNKEYLARYIEDWDTIYSWDRDSDYQEDNWDYNEIEIVSIIPEEKYPAEIYYEDFQNTNRF